MRRRYRNKYKAIKVTYDGITFDSKLEGARYKVLKMLQEAGEISDLETQVPYRCDVNGKVICRYYADFRYKVNERVIVEDTKGVLTHVFNLKKKLVEALYPDVSIEIVTNPNADVLPKEAA